MHTGDEHDHVVAGGLLGFVTTRLYLVAQDGYVHDLNPPLAQEGRLESVNPRPADDLPEASSLKNLRNHQAQEISWRQLLPIFREVRLDVLRAPTTPIQNGKSQLGSHPPHSHSNALVERDDGRLTRSQRLLELRESPSRGPPSCDSAVCARDAPADGRHRHSGGG